jgi:subtilisin family serine protease
MKNAPPGSEPRRAQRRRWAALLVTILLLAALVIAVYPLLPELGRLLGLVPENEWALSATQTNRLRAQGLDGSGVILCVVDTGVDLSHPDLRGITLLAWKDMVNGIPEPYDDDGHGTAMVGLIAARGRVDGFSPGVSLIVVKAIEEGGEGLASVVVEAMSFCMDPFGDGTRSHIISLSLGGSSRPLARDEVAEKAREAVSRGILVVASAGNEGPTARDVQSPASEELVIAVGAVDRSLTIAPFSQRGDNDPSPFNPKGRQDPNRKPEVVAPGVDLVTTGLNGTYVKVSGTSAAAAVVSSILALVLQGQPTLKAGASSSLVLDLKLAIMLTARTLDDQEEPHDDRYGYGLIQGLDLMEALVTS